MGWQSLVGPAIGLVGGAIQGSKNRKAAKELANQQAQMGTARETAEEQQRRAMEGLQWQTDYNNANQLWADDLNRGNLEWQTGMNWNNQILANQINQNNLYDQFMMNQGALQGQNQANRENQLWAAMMNQALMGNTNDLNRGNQAWANSMTQQNLLGQNAMNRENQAWAQGLNQQAIDRQTQQNRLDWSRDGFGSGRFNEATNSYDISLDPSQQRNLDIIRSKQAGILEGLGKDFDVNGDVMNAYRGFNQPLVDEARNKENARLAAMGLGTGSGSAWMNAQRSLSDAQTRADQQAILQGFQADQALRQSNRADLGSMGQMENSMWSQMQGPQYNQAGVAQVQGPQAGVAQVQGPQMGSNSVNMGMMSGPNINAPNMGAAQMGAAQIGAPTTGVSQINPSTVVLPGQDLLGAWTKDQNMAAGNAWQQQQQNAGWGNLLGQAGSAVGDYFKNNPGTGGGGSNTTIDSGAFGQDFPYGDVM